MKNSIIILVAIMMIACSRNPNGNETKQTADTSHQWASCPAVPLEQMHNGAIGCMSSEKIPYYNGNNADLYSRKDAEEIRRLIYKSAVSCRSMWGPTFSPYYDKKQDPQDGDPMTNSIAAYFKSSWSRTQENKLFNSVISSNGPVAMMIAYITTMEIFSQELERLSLIINNPPFRGDTNTRDEYEYIRASSGWGSVRLVRKDYNYESHEIMEDNDSSILIYCHKLYESADVYNRVVIFQNPSWDECIPRNTLIDTCDSFNDFKYEFYKNYFNLTVK